MPTTVQNKKVQLEIKELRSRLLYFNNRIKNELAIILNVLEENAADLFADAQFSKEEALLISEEIDRRCTALIMEGGLSLKTLRFLLTTQKVVMDLNRIDDICINISRRMLNLYDGTAFLLYPEILKMVNAAKEMLQNAMKAYLFANVVQAEAILWADKAMDDLTHKLFERVFQDMQNAQFEIGKGIALISIIKYLERIGDHTCSIAELTIFMDRGEYKNGRV